jgi:tetratricopeptide (TPR) repeat protein
MTAALAAALLSACASQQAAAPPPPPPPPPAPAPVAEAPKPAEPVYTATPGLAPRERFRAAVKDLETGEAGQAKAELNQYLIDVPTNNKRAQALLSQIDSPVEEYFPPESFTVVVGTGESLSTLAQTFLGDSLKFYILARYNGISNPSQVSAGQTVKIPKTPATLQAKDNRDKGIVAKPTAPEAAEAAAEEPEEAPADTKAAPPARAAPKGTTERIRRMAAAGDTEGAIKEIEANRLGPGASAADATFFADTYLASAKALKAGNPALANTRAQKAGDLYLQVGDKPDKALEAAQLASSVNPNNAHTQKLLNTARTATADRYYRNGLAAFRRQELDAAIAAWDKVLEIDPNHENAKLQRAQALELKDKLSKLK